MVCGHSGSGKSTLARGLLSSGAKLLSDDIAAFSNYRSVVRRGPPGVRLCPHDAPLSTNFQTEHDKIRYDTRTLDCYGFGDAPVTKLITLIVRDDIPRIRSFQLDRARALVLMANLLYAPYLWTDGLRGRRQQSSVLRTLARILGRAPMTVIERSTNEDPQRTLELALSCALTE